MHDLLKTIPSTSPTRLLQSQPSAFNKIGGGTRCVSSYRTTEFLFLLSDFSYICVGVLEELAASAYDEITWSLYASFCYPPADAGKHLKEVT